MKIGALQLDIVKNDKEVNLNKIEKYLKEETLDLLVLPELFSTGYFYETIEEREKLAEIIPEGTTTQKLLEIAEKTKTYIVGAILEKEEKNLYITAIVVGPEGFIGKYRKRNLTSDEKKIYKRGNDSLVFEVKGVKVGVIICFEAWIPESVRELTMKGAQIVLHTALICSEKTLEILKVRAIENGSYIAVANACSTEMFEGNRFTFRGDSRIINPSGETVVNAFDKEGLISYKIKEKLEKTKKLPDSDDLLEEIRVYK